MAPNTPPAQSTQAPPAFQTGSAIQPIYATRNMKCYPITDSELKQLGLANLGMTATFGLGSACFAFALDIFKDTKLAETIPPAADVLVNAIQPLGFIFGAAMWAVSIAIWVWRGSLIKTIKEESA